VRVTASKDGAATCETSAANSCSGVDNWMSDFIQRQAEGKLHLFWPAMMEAWFKKYPAHGNLGYPLPTDKNKRLLTPDELVMLGAAIKVKRGVSDALFTAFDTSMLIPSLPSNLRTGSGTVARKSATPTAPPPARPTR
jgi:hypothetical protein